MDERFDRIYFLRIQSDELSKLKQLCDDYCIQDNGVFEDAVDFHIVWGIGPEGLIYLSPAMFTSCRPDFNFIEELEMFLNDFIVVN